MYKVKVQSMQNAISYNHSNHTPSDSGHFGKGIYLSVYKVEIQKHAVI